MAKHKYFVSCPTYADDGRLRLVIPHQLTELFHNASAVEWIEDRKTGKITVIPFETVDK